jgi:hypothetical protein
MHRNMKSSKKEGKSMRIRVTTTLREDLWRALQIEAIKENTDCNSILEDLMAEYLKKAKRKGGER